MHPAENVFHMVDLRRPSWSRGRPALTAAFKYFDMGEQAFDAALVAAKVQACLTTFVPKKDFDDDTLGPTYGGGVHPSGRDDETGYGIERLEPGIIVYGDADEGPPTSIGMKSPNDTFEPFMKFILSLSGQCVNMPLMLITGDFAGATFMNSRMAYKHVQGQWECEQQWRIAPMTYWTRRRWIRKMIAENRISDHPGKDQIKVYCKTWPYVDPYKESMAEKIMLNDLQTTNRHEIAAKRGKYWPDINEQRKKEEKDLAVQPPPTPEIPDDKEKTKKSA